MVFRRNFSCAWIESNTFSILFGGPILLIQSCIYITFAYTHAHTQIGSAVGLSHFCRDAMIILTGDLLISRRLKAFTPSSAAPTGTDRNVHLLILKWDLSLTDCYDNRWLWYRCSGMWTSGLCRRHRVTIHPPPPVYQPSLLHGHRHNIQNSQSGTILSQ